MSQHIDAVAKQSDIDTLSSKLTNLIKTNGTPSIVIICNVLVSFTNGEGEADLSSYVPSGYRLSIPVCCPTNTGSLTVSGCYKKDNSNTVVHIRLSNQSHTGDVSMNIFASCIAT